MDNSKDILNQVIVSFDNMVFLDQVSAIEEKMKSIIGVMNQLNNNKELLKTDTEDKNELTKIYGLLCTLEDELGTYLLKED